MCVEICNDYEYQENEGLRQLCTTKVSVLILRLLLLQFYCHWFINSYNTSTTVMLWKKTSIYSVDKGGFVSHPGLSVIACLCPFFLFVLFYISAFPCSFCSLGADSCVAKAFFQQMLRCRRNPCTSLHPAAPAVRQFTSAYYLVVALRWSVYYTTPDQSSDCFLNPAFKTKLKWHAALAARQILSLISAQIRLGVVMSRMAKWC